MLLGNIRTLHAYPVLLMRRGVLLKGAGSGEKQCSVVSEVRLLHTLALVVQDLLATST